MAIEYERALLSRATITLAPGGRALEQLRAIQPSARLAPIPDGWPAAPRLANWSRILSYLIYDEDA